MANENLPRVLQNIFGANAMQGNKIAQFGSVIAGNPLYTGDIKQIQALQYWQNGWVGATISDKRYPTSEETTGINKVVTQQLAYLFQKGMPEWLDNETYFDGSFCQVKGVIYKSVKDNNINNNPVTDSGENWQIFRTSASETELENLMPYIQRGVIGSSLSLTNTHVPAGGTRYYNNGLTITHTTDSCIGTISNFSNTNWLMLSKPFPSTVAYRVEHDFTCTLPQLDQTVFGYNFNDSVGIRNGKLSLIIKGVTYEGTTELQANQKYYWLLVHADSGDTAMRLYTKTNLADDWNLEVSVPIAYNVWADLSIYLGAAGNNPNTYFRGTMSTDLIILEQSAYAPNNITMIGTPTINGNNIGGFSTSSYAKASTSAAFPSLNSFEMQFAFNSGPLTNPNGRIMNIDGGTDSSLGPFVEIKSASCALSFFNGTAYYGCNALSNLQPNTNYICRWVYNGTNIKGYYSLDGKEFILVETMTPSYTPMFNNTQFALGNRAADHVAITTFQGTIDLKNSYIILNNTYQWLGINPYYKINWGASNAYDMLSINGTLVGWCPDGRNSNDKTLKNQSVTFNGNNNTILSEVDKDIYFALPDSRLIIGKTHEDTVAPTKNLQPGDVWYNPNTNVNQIYSTISPNLINNGCTITNGVVSGFSATNYIEPFGVFNLEDNWSIKLALGANMDTVNYAGLLGCNGIKLYTNQGISSISYAVQKTIDGVITLGYVQTAGPNGTFVPAETTIFKDANFTEELGVATGSDYVYNTNRNIIFPDSAIRRTEAKLYRKDIQKVSKQTEVGTSYQVAYQGVIGYVATEGLVGTFVPNETQVYSDSNLQFGADVATGDTYIYTGNSSPIYDITYGYAKTEGIPGQYLEDGTIIYSDTNANITLTTASGTDYMFTDEYSPSIITFLFIPQTSSTKNITLSYDGTTYTLSSEDGSTTFNSPDYVKGSNIIELGRCDVDNDGTNLQYLINNSLNLLNSEFSFWTWNNISTPTSQWIPFIGIKFGYTKGVTGYLDNATIFNSGKSSIPVQQIDGSGVTAVKVENVVVTNDINTLLTNANIPNNTLILGYGGYI